MTGACPGLVGAALVATASSAAAPPSRLLSPLSPSDWKTAGVGGTGCWWHARGDLRWRFAMSGRAAVAKLAGRLVVLKSAAGAPDAFPFTFDRWRAGVTAIHVVRTGRAVRAGRELLREPASIEISIGPRRTVFSGTLECGS